RESRQQQRGRLHGHRAHPFRGHRAAHQGRVALLRHAPRAGAPQNPGVDPYPPQKGTRVIRRTVYLVAGIVVGGYVMYRFGRSARVWSPGGIADRVEKRIGCCRGALREFDEDGAGAVRDYEEELLRRYAPDFQRQGLPEASRYWPALVGG